MATIRKKSSEYQASELQNGDRMTREEFHGVYETCAEDFKAELIGGIVYVASPLKLSHGEHHLKLGSIFNAYQVATPGVACYDNATVMLSDEDEVQPDLCLRINPECGGRSQDTADEYVSGPPELAAEIAHSSRAIDLHAKKDRYAKSGVLEYMVLCLKPKHLYWYNLQTGAELAAGSDGIIRSAVFPGLWIGPGPLLALDFPESLALLNLGLDSTEHVTFVARLAASRSS